MTTIRDITYVGEGLIPAPEDGAALRYTPLPKGNVTDIAIHHMTGWNPPPDATPEQEIRFLQGIDSYHRTSRGLDGIGYQICPMASGRVYIVSRLDRYGAHVGYENDHLIGIGLPGDYTSHLPSSAHLTATVGAVRHAYEYLGRDVPTTPHLYWGGTSCPGARWREWVPQLRAQALTIQEEDMTPEEVIELIKAHAPGAFYEALGTPEGTFTGLKRRIRTTAHPNDEQHGGAPAKHGHEAKVTLT